jgi:nucleoside-diphosphate-sugar epimerase
MTMPSQRLIEFMTSLRGPLLVLGASGKMGPTLAVRAKRGAVEAGKELEVIAVSRFSDAAAREWLESRDVRTISCDLLDRDAVMGLPEAPDIIYMAGRKFGTGDDPSLTWAMNSLAPVHVCERYPGGRIVALSTGCVYPFVPIEQGGSHEDDPLTPLGEYSNACVARERLFEYYSRHHGNRVVQIRLNYAIDLRYGVLVDIAERVMAEEPVDLTMGYFNCIWQGDANDMIIRSLELASSPQRAINLTGAEQIRVRDVAERFGALMGREVMFTGSEAPTALLSDATDAFNQLGRPSISLDTIIRWIAHWLMSDGRRLGRPTHFEVRDGGY